jgi:hypothetical protein
MSAFDPKRTWLITASLPARHFETFYVFICNPSPLGTCGRPELLAL